MLDTPVDMDWVNAEIKKIPRLEKQRLEGLVDGIFLFAPEEYLNENDDDEDEESDSEITARHLEEKFKPKKDKQPTEPITQTQQVDNKKQQTSESNKVQAEKKQVAKKEVPKYPPKFHLEPVPAEFLPETVEAEELSPEAFKDRFKRMREYMTARRKASNQDDKRKRRDERRQKRKTKAATPQKDNSQPTTTNPTQVKAQEVKSLVMTKIVKNEGDRKKVGPNAKQALEKLRVEEEKLEQLKWEDPEAAQKIQDKTILKRALAKARGESVKDDAGKLKRTLKRQEVQKKKSEKQWTEKKHQVKRGQKTRVEKREKNIKERIEKIKTKKQRKQKRR